MSQATSDDPVLLQWGSGEDSFQDKYIVKHRDTDRQSKSVQVSGDIVQTSVTISDLEAGHKYEFEVIASSHGEKSKPAYLISVTSKNAIILRLKSKNGLPAIHK